MLSTSTNTPACVLIAPPSIMVRLTAFDAYHAGGRLGEVRLQQQVLRWSDSHPSQRRAWGGRSRTTRPDQFTLRQKG